MKGRERWPTVTTGVEMNQNMKMLMAAAMKPNAPRADLNKAAVALRDAGVARPIWRAACEAVGRYDAAADYVAKQLVAV